MWLNIITTVKQYNSDYETKISINALHDDTTRKFYKTRFIWKIKENKIDKEDVDEIWSKLKNNTLVSAKESLETIRIDKYTNEETNKTPQFNEEVKELSSNKTNKISEI